jgi:hypothetical protein
MENHGPDDPVAVYIREVGTVTPLAKNEETELFRKLAELYENHAQIAEDRCRQAHLLRGEYEARNPIKASTASFDEALNDTMPDQVQFRFDFDAGVPWEATS